jgi:hypothetical protein
MENETKKAYYGDWYCWHNQEERDQLEAWFKIWPKFFQQKLPEGATVTDSQLISRPGWEIGRPGTVGCKIEVTMLKGTQYKPDGLLLGYDD